MHASSAAYWASSAEEILVELRSLPQGLSQAEAQGRRRLHVADRIVSHPKASAFRLLARQFKSPITLLLIAAGCLSLVLRDHLDAGIILAIVLGSTLLGYWQEWAAADALAKLVSLISTRVRVFRDGECRDIPLDEIVAGDVLQLAAGDKVPGDCLVLEAKDLSVDEAALTGESNPTEKQPGVMSAESPLALRHNALFFGTHVVSGTGTALVVRVGRATEFGQLSQRLRWHPPEPEFERGVRRFGMLLTEVTLVMLIVIFAINAYFERNALDSLMFALALAVGLTPQLLPAIISVNLAHGSRRMAKQQVIVRRLSSIENLGSLDVLCFDKTGTLTEGSMTVHSAIGVDGQSNPRVARLAFLNSAFETGFANPIDHSIRESLRCDLSQVHKLDELPFDFVRKRLGILVGEGDRRRLIVKGALVSVLGTCAKVETRPGEAIRLSEASAQIDRIYRDLSSQGFRVLAVAEREIVGQDRVSHADEIEMTLVGFVVLHDPLKAGIGTAVQRLQAQGVGLKVISGDHRLVVSEIASQIGLSRKSLITGAELRSMTDAALVRKVRMVDLFAEIEPNQKERIVLALRKSGHVVGYLGDGINDVSAMHGADVGISVDQAVDVAKEAADIVLLERNLQVLSDGISEGRVTFANTMKYIFMATSANFGNMFSMAIASLFLPFLPLLPKQVLLINLLTDLPEMMIARDRVDPELIERPTGWNVALIRRFMLVFGPVSSLFDLLTFAVLLSVAGAGREQFRAGWFVESVVSAALVVLVIRTRKPFWKSLPSQALLLATFGVIVAALLIPVSPLASPLEFAPLSATIYAYIGIIVMFYVASAEAAKGLFYRLANTTNTPVKRIRN